MRSVRLNFRVLIAGAALLASAVQASAFWAPKHKRNVRAEVTLVDKQWRDAQLSNDVAALDKLLSDDYLGITGNGQVVTKLQQLDRVRNRQTQLEKLDISDLKVKIVGSVAIVTSSAELDGIADGRKIHGAFRSTRIYQRLPNGSWKITSFEATPTRLAGGLQPQS